MGNFLGCCQVRFTMLEAFLCKFALHSLPIGIADIFLCTEHSQGRTRFIALENLTVNQNPLPLSRLRSHPKFHFVTGKCIFKISIQHFHYPGLILWMHQPLPGLVFILYLLYLVPQYSLPRGVKIGLPCGAIPIPPPP